MFLTVGRGGGAIFTCKHFVFLYAAPAANYFFVCVSVFLHILYFLLPYNLFQYLQPLQTIYFKIFQPPTPRQKIMVRP